MAKRWHTGVGSYRLKDGSSVKILSDSATRITRLFQVKNGRLISAEAARGNNQIAAMMDRYASKAANIEEADDAWLKSFDAIF